MRSERVNWTAIAAIGTTVAVLVVMMIAFVNGSIQLGSTQTHVTINTERLDKVETDIKDFRGRLAKLEASGPEQDRRLTILEQLNVTNAAIEETRRQSLATKDDLQQSRNTSHVEFVSEIKRLDDLFKLLQARIAAVSEREDKRHIDGFKDK